MNRTPLNFYSGELDTNASTVRYTPPTLTIATISQATVTNITSGAVALSIAISQNGTNYYHVYHQVTIAANETKVLSGLIGLSVSAGGGFEAWAGANSALDLTLSGYLTSV